MARVLALAVLLVLCRDQRDAAGQSLMPSSGIGMSQRFTLRFDDPAGAVHVRSAWVWFSASFLSTAAHSCQAYYDRPSNTLNLINDAGTAWLSAALGTSGTLQNGSCSVDVARATAAIAGPTLTLTLPVRFTSAFTGSKHVFLYSASMSAVASGWHPRGVWTVASVSETVTAPAVTPSSGTGLQQSFTFDYGDATGAEHLTNVWARFADRWQTTAGDACFFYYSRPSNTLHLLNDAGTAYTSGTPGTAATLQNSQCAIALGGTAAVQNGSSLALTVPMTFTPAFHGFKYVYTEADNLGGSSSGWQTRGTWIVGSGAPPAVTAESVHPHAGVGMSRTFAVQFRNAAGAADLRHAWVWFNSAFTASSANSCMVYYSRPSNTLFLINDGGTGWLTATLGTDAPLQNSSCAVGVRDASVVLDGPTLTLHLPVTFTAAFSGSKHIFLYADNAGGTNSGWQPLGTWTVASIADTVTAAGVTPNAGGGASQSFAFDFGEAGGAEHLSDVWAWFGPGWAATAASSCLFHYDRAANTLYLLNDAGTAYTAGTPGAGGTLQNAQCSIALAGVSTTSTGPSMRVNASVAFTPAFAGPKYIYTVAFARGGTTSGWQTQGTWLVPGAAVTADSVLPSNGSGTSQTFELRYSHGLGAASLSQAWVWFSETFAATSELTCLAYYDRPSHTVSLIDDTGTAWQRAPLGGSTATLQNSRCAIDIAATTVSLGGSTLTLSLPVRFDARADGTKQIYMLAMGEGGTSGWQARGTWTVPPPSDAVGADRVTPEAGAGAAGTFALQYSHTAGAGHLTHAWVWFTERFSTVSAGSCMVYYDRASHRVYLLNDAGTGWVGAPAGESGPLQNTQCAIVPSAAAVVVVSQFGDGGNRPVQNGPDRPALRYPSFWSGLYLR